MNENEAKVKYTPGPWAADGCTVETDNGPDIAVTGYGVVWSPPIDQDERYANARLIAAAPDGLGFAEEFLQWAENFGAAWVWEADDSEVLCHDEGWQGLVAMAKAFAAKALGEEAQS